MTYAEQHTRQAVHDLGLKLAAKITLPPGQIIALAHQFLQEDNDPFRHAVAKTFAAALLHGAAQRVAREAAQDIEGAPGAR